MNKMHMEFQNVLTSMDPQLMKAKHIFNLDGDRFKDPVVAVWFQIYAAARLRGMVSAANDIIIDDGKWLEAMIDLTDTNPPSEMLLMLLKDRKTKTLLALDKFNEHGL